MKRRTMFILLLTLFLLFLAAASIFLVSVDPKIKKRNEALTMMAPTVEFSKVTKFYLYNTDTSYYTVMGEDKRRGMPSMRLFLKKVEMLQFFNNQQWSMSKKLVLYITR